MFSSFNPTDSTPALTLSRACRTCILGADAKLPSARRGPGRRHRDSPQHSLPVRLSGLRWMESGQETPLSLGPALAIVKPTTSKDRGIERRLTVAQLFPRLFYAAFFCAALSTARNLCPTIISSPGLIVMETSSI